MLLVTMSQKRSLVVLIAAADPTAFEDRDGHVAELESEGHLAILAVPARRAMAGAGAVGVPVRRGRLAKAARVIRQEPAAHPPAVVERALPTSWRIDKFLRGAKANVVLLVGDSGGTFLADMAQSAHAAGIRTRAVGSGERWLEAAEAAATQPRPSRRSPAAVLLRPLLNVYMAWWRLRKAVRLRTRLRAKFGSGSQGV